MDYAAMQQNLSAMHNSHICMFSILNLLFSVIYLVEEFELRGFCLLLWEIDVIKS